jgi:hypothetical protein
MVSTILYGSGFFGAMKNRWFASKLRGERILGKAS